MDSEIQSNGGAQETGRSSLHEVLCHVRMFKPQFAPLVEAGTKCQTVRPTPRRMPKAGDRISLRMWTGKPYRSKQRVLREATISEVSLCTIYESAVYVSGKPEHRHGFAVADGFSDYGELADWFKTTHGLPFDGVVIKWHNAPIQRRADGNLSTTEPTP